MVFFQIGGYKLPFIINGLFMLLTAIAIIFILPPFISERRTNDKDGKICMLCRHFKLNHVSSHVTHLSRLLGGIYSSLYRTTTTEAACPTPVYSFHLLYCLSIIGVVSMGAAVLGESISHSVGPSMITHRHT